MVLSARRALGSVEGERPTLFIGVELDRWQEEDRAAAMDALGRALGAQFVPWSVNLLLLDIAQDPLAKVICSDASLSQTDLEFVQAYQALRQQVGMPGLQPCASRAPSSRSVGHCFTSPSVM